MDSAMSNKATDKGAKLAQKIEARYMTGLLD